VGRHCPCASPLPFVGRTFLSDAFDLSVAVWTSHTLWVATACVGRTFLSDAFDLSVALWTSHTLWVATAHVGRTFLSDAFDLELLGNRALAGRTRKIYTGPDVHSSQIIVWIIAKIRSLGQTLP
jgi:hypothetical protein